MKRSIQSLAVGTLLVLLVGSLGFAVPGAQETKTVTGVVKAVDAANMSLQITEDVTNQEFTFKVEETTVITKGDMTITLADVQPGDKVEAVLGEGKLVALRVK